MGKARTAQNFLKDLEEKDVSVAQWCREHGISPNTVWAVARGSVMGRRGEARRAMRLMGLAVPSPKRPRPDARAEVQA